jgi:hypothetical protein
MSQYDDRVNAVRDRLAAEEWANGVKSLHAHSLESMWYDTGRKDGRVIDVQFNSGLIERLIVETDEKVYFGEALTGQELVDAWNRSGPN